MEISCDIIRDVLPLYAEDMISNATREMVDQHLCGCDGCTKELGGLKKAQTVPLDADTHSLDRVKKTIRRRRTLAVLAVLLTIGSILVSVIQFAVVPIYLPYEKAIESVELRDDGALVIDYSRAVIGQGGVVSKNGNKFMHCYTTVYDYCKAKLLDKKLEGMTRKETEAYIADYYLIEKYYQRTEITAEEWNRFFNIETNYCFQNELGQKTTYTQPQLPERTTNLLEGTYSLCDHDYGIIYLFRDGNGGSVILDEGEKELDWSLIEKRWQNDLYEEIFWGCLIMSVLLGCWIHWKKPQHREFLYRCVILFGSIAFGILVVSHGQFDYMSQMLSHNWRNGAVGAAGMTFLTALLWRRLYVMNHQEKSV